MAIIPSDAWRAIGDGSLNGHKCPWCMSKRLAALGMNVRCELHLMLPGLSALNVAALEQAEEIDRMRWAEQHNVREVGQCQP